RPRPTRPAAVSAAAAGGRRAPGATAVPRGAVVAAAAPPHSPTPPAHSTTASAYDTLTGPEAGACPSTASPGSASRSETVVSDAVEHAPPAPCAVHDAVPVLSRTPGTSPEAAPDVADAPVPEHVVAGQLTVAAAVLVACSSRADPPAATRSADQGSRSTSVFPASDVDSAA